ncbi:uncharacterized protein LOC125751054 [Brienomyrus brachyistius]|uniref:uncharacterized protein LOC125751054 n=1 Tax=Brienomyrus brachyistius TaxID=42636 RepID=UPI0020B18A1C|nr:uncharacterized protein LOC125751054 [Brienomyrus brachyistius]XP_048885479.1 uncharacterized protein LOC125751054 [Brienomyrus brachyistius]
METKRLESAVRPKRSEATVRQKTPESTSQLTECPSTAQSHDYPTESPLTDSPVDLEGWVRLWENPNGIPSADISWLKEDTERGMFTPVQIYRDHTGHLKRRRVMKSDRMWFYPPECPGYVRGSLPNPDLFFRSRVFVWRPVGVWRCSLKCPRGEACVGAGQNVHLYKSGFHHRVRQICDVSNWYTMLTEVLCCGPCTKAARRGDGGTIGRWLAWDPAILSQLSEAHRALFPAILTTKRGVDRNVMRLLRHQTEGNTVVKVWRQIQEYHAEGYLRCMDLYTTLLMPLVEPGGIVSASKQTFKAPPPQREIPSARLLRHAIQLAEADSGPPCTRLPPMEYVPTPSTAGTKVLKGRTDVVMPLSQSQPSLSAPLRQTPPTSTITRPVTSLSASTAAPLIAGPSTQPIMLASQSALVIPVFAGPPIRPITPTSQSAPVTVALPTSVCPSVPMMPACTTVSTSHSTGRPSAWARATQYKRKLKEAPSGAGGKLSRIQNLPVCTLCGQPTQGHKKYKKKSFCPVKMMSPSKGLSSRVYASYEHFTSVVDDLQE